MGPWTLQCYISVHLALPRPHTRHQPGPGLREPSGCSQVLSAPAVLALLLVGKRGLRVILAGQWLGAPGSSLLRRAHTRCRQSSCGFYETLSLGRHCSSSLHARCRMALSGLFSASRRPCCAARGPRGHTCALCATLPSLEMHTREWLGQPLPGQGATCAHLARGKAPFPRAPHWKRNACLVSPLLHRSRHEAAFL